MNSKILVSVLIILSFSIGYLFICFFKPSIEDRFYYTTDITQIKNTVQLSKNIKDVVYKNKNIGFNMHLPKGWEKYKVIERNDSTRSWLEYIEFFLPTQDSSYEEQKPFPYMASVGVIAVWPKERWDSEKISCAKDGQKPGCPDDENKILQNNKYVLDFTNPQAVPNDLINSLTNIIYLRENSSFNY